MSPPNLDYVVKLLGFPLKSFPEALKAGNKCFLQSVQSREMDRCWNNIVAGLPKVDVIVRMDSATSDLSPLEF